MLLWIVALRELFHRGWIESAAWVPTESMICDAQTKWFNGTDLGWLNYYRTGEWRPFYMEGFEADFLTSLLGKIESWKQDSTWRRP